MALQLDSRQYDSQLLELIVLAGGSCKSYAIAAKLLGVFLPVNISAKQVSLLTTLVGDELRQLRDKQTRAWQERPFDQLDKVVQPPPQLACVQVDGGRIQTRGCGLGQGVYDPHWRETKNAGFYRMASESFSEDPHPKLPECFSSRKNMGQLLAGLSDELADDEEASSQATGKPDFSWRPQPLFRSCLSSLVSSDAFGPMMAAEADRRGFFTATRRAFLGDGLSYNWTIQKKYFPAFVPILDFIHVVEHLYKVSQSLEPDTELSWQQAVNWIESCWQGDVMEVIGILKAKQLVIGLPAEDGEAGDPRRVVAETIGYLLNNARRMNYPCYRREGLPMTSCLIESQIKELNHRVKGSEKFWNDGSEGEAILQVVAAMLGDEEQLSTHFKSRPGNPYQRNRAPK